MIPLVRKAGYEAHLISFEHLTLGSQVRSMPDYWHEITVKIENIWRPHALIDPSHMTSQEGSEREVHVIN